MSMPNFFDMTDEAEKIDDTIHNLISITEDTLSENKAIFVEEDDGVLKYQPKEILKSDISDLSIEGDNNQFLLSDGANWAKSSGIFYGEIEKALFEDTRFQLTPATTEYFKIAPSDDVLGNVVISQILIKETDGETETTVYNLGTDDNLEDILTNENAVLKVILPEDKTMEQCCSVDTGNRTITLLNWSSWFRQTSLGINSSLFDNTKQYKIYITSDRTLSLYCKDVLMKKGDSFIFETDKCFKEKSITDLGNFSLNQFAIKKSGDTGYHFAISDTSRLTVHDDSKADITRGATLFMHGAATLEIDDGENRYTGSAAGSSSSSIAALRLHDKAVFDMSQGAWLKMDGASSFIMSQEGYWKVIDSAKGILEGTSFFKLYPDNNYSPYFALGGGAVFLINADDDSANKASAMVLDPDGLIYISDGGSGVNSSDSPVVDYSALGRNPSTMAPANKSTSIKISGETYLNIDTESGASTYIKISGDNNPTSQVSNSQVCLILTGNVFNQMSGNAHSEMHNDSKFIMRGAKTTSHWNGTSYDIEPVQQGTNGPILGMYGKPTVTIGGYIDEPLLKSRVVNVTITDPDISTAPTSYADLSAAGKAIVFGYVSGPENTVTAITITSSTANTNGGYDVTIGTISYSQHPVTTTAEYNGTRTTLVYSETGTVPATFADLSSESIEKIKTELGFTKCVTDIELISGTIGTVTTYSYRAIVTIEDLVYTCTANQASFFLPKQEDNPRVAILNNADIKIYDDFSIEANQNGITFSDGANSESFTIEELTALKALLI